MRETWRIRWHANPPALLAMHKIRRSDAESEKGELGRFDEMLNSFWAYLFPCNWEETIDILYFSGDLGRFNFSTF
jgi:hypothetical protein